MQRIADYELEQTRNGSEEAWFGGAQGTFESIIDEFDYPPGKPNQGYD